MSKRRTESQTPTSLRLPDSLMNQVKIVAARSGMSITAIVERALEVYLGRACEKCGRRHDGEYEKKLGELEAFAARLVSELAELRKGST